MPTGSPPPPARPPRLAVKTRAGVARGFTYLGVLLALALWSALAAGWAQQAAHAQRRERERELLFRGGQIARAIASYRAAQPDGRGPRSLDELLDDRRGPQPRHHLRRLWADPVTGQADWLLLRDAQQAIVGVHSRSPALRVLQAAGPEADGPRLTDWHFTAPGGAPASAAPAP